MTRAIRSPGVTVLIAILSAWLSPPASANPEASGDSTVTSTEGSALIAGWERVGLDQIGTGEMLLRIDGDYYSLPMLHTDVTLDINGLMVHGTVKQTFTNPTDGVIEAIYVFPLPEHGAINHMEMRIGERRIVSTIREREMARKTYERAKRAGKKAALLEQERPNLFTTSVANINPGQEIDVILELIDEARFRNGAFSFAFPLTFTPRYIPGGQARVGEATGRREIASSIVSDADRITPPFTQSANAGAPTASFRARLNAGFPLASLTCSSHDVRTDESKDAWRIEPIDGHLLADRDVLLEWHPAPAAMPHATLLTERHSGERYGLMMLVPVDADDGETDDASGTGLSTETMFVIDVSGSMDGPSIRQARDALVAALDRLRPGDRFNILKFNNANEVMSGTLLTATPENLTSAKRWVRGLDASGGTEIYAALLRALSMMSGGPARGDGRRDHDPTVDLPASRVILLTDGAVGNERQLFERLAQGIGDIRLHVIGIGFAPNRHLVRKMATLGRGTSHFIARVSDEANKIDAILAKLNRPVMSDLKLVSEDMTLEDVYPVRLPDLYAGDPLIVSARISGETAGGRIDLIGRTERGAFRKRFDLSHVAADGSGIATRWARRKVTALMDRKLDGADPEEIRTAVVELGTAFHLVTRYTSLVAVEERITAEGPARPRRIANALPHGSQLLGAARYGGPGLPRGGTNAPLQVMIALLLKTAGGLIWLATRMIGGRHGTAS